MKSAKSRGRRVLPPREYEHPPFEDTSEGAQMRGQRIALMAARWGAGLDLATGLPLQGKDRADWERLRALGEVA